MKSKYFLLLGVSCFLFSGCQSNEKKSQNSVSTSNEPIELKLSDLQEEFFHVRRRIFRRKWKNI